MAPTIRPMTVAELSSPMYCANRAEKSCMAAARVWVAGTPYCKRCGNRVSKSNRRYNWLSEAAKLPRQDHEMNSRPAC